MTDSRCTREQAGTYDGQCHKPMSCEDHPTNERVRTLIADLHASLDAAKTARKDGRL